MNTKPIFKLSLLILAMSVNSAVFSAEVPNFNKQQTSGIAVPDFSKVGNIDGFVQKRTKSPQVQQKIATQKAQVQQKKAVKRTQKQQVQQTQKSTAVANVKGIFSEKIQQDLIGCVSVMKIQVKKQRFEGLQSLVLSGNQVAMIWYAAVLSNINDSDYEYELYELGFDDDVLIELNKIFNSGTIQEQSYAGYMLGVYYYNVENYQYSLSFIEKSANQGGSDAQLKLGNMYYDGSGVPQSNTEAIKWYRKAAEQGHPSAQYNLAIMYDQGKGVERSDKESFKWFLRSAEQGHPSAQYNVGVMYENGDWVQKSDLEAAKWYRKSAEQGSVWGQFKMGSFYKSGIGVPQSNTEAIKWYRKAAEQGSDYAKDELIELQAN